MNKQRRYEAVSSLSTANKKQQFLQALSLGATVKAASDHADVDRSRPYLWRQTDPAFGASCLQARSSLPEELEVAAFALALGASVKAASEYANVDRSTPYLWRQTDPAFAAAWLQARSSRLEELEEAALALAVEGNGGNGPMLRFLISRHDAARTAERPRPAVRQVTIIPPAPVQADGVGVPLVGAQASAADPIQEFITVGYANRELKEMPSEIPQDKAGKDKSAMVPAP